MKISLLSTLALFMVCSAHAVPQSLTAKGGAVEFAAIGKPSFIHINGKGEAAKGSVLVDGKKVSGSFEFSVATLDTGIEMRNEHMRDKYLKVKEHPNAKLTIAGFDLAKDFSLAQPELDGADFKGDLTLSGVTQPVVGKFKVGKSKNVEAEFKIKLSDYKIDIPKYMGITVADEVTIKVLVDSLVASNAAEDTKKK